jgi:phosphatidylserine decarboxylase
MTFAKEAWPFVLPPALGAGVLAVLGFYGWAGALAVLALAVLLFFRDPHRYFDGGPESLVAPADGKVLAVDTVEDPEIGPGRFRLVVTFLSVFDVHVQRTPTAGEVVRSELTPGPKVAAYKHDAARNERHLTVLRRDNGDLVGIRQVVGLVARRIVCYLQSGKTVERGELLGLIRFGSRVDLLVPESYEVLVAPGDRVRNGETVMAQTPQAGTTSQAAPP